MHTLLPSMLCYDYRGRCLCIEYFRVHAHIHVQGSRKFAFLSPTHFTRNLRVRAYELSTAHSLCLHLSPQIKCRTRSNPCMTNRSPWAKNEAMCTTKHKFTPCMHIHRGFCVKNSPVNKLFACNTFCILGQNMGHEECQNTAKNIANGVWCLFDCYKVA